ncbi:hypothetical protein [[Haemophilus] ducreyi]|uniref:hypothetical protein n=1 Tax=Haemophilus ducreyi TaxID=730 RepID=UPI0006550518|nr:hypothetical protein [[Haemophilus] ducreyi]AKO45709.1 hypothetical protein RZ66_05670 [[Haemophilus] ducreyi]AKO47095.1 hypothetical protein RZ67_05595 [[Haemophilus] ducreyi]AKO48440.1 hypothetical protein RZ68_05580 [[Haemophilus] ducreyi]AKO49825.1 hypothetical protein RZ69_05605 [[Haemophilus] ducreyi]ANF62147.1 hypothetical protein A6037_05185 [[Haemophilus] ducreyi]
MKKYSVKFHVNVQPEEDNLGIKASIGNATLPPQLTEIMSDFLVKIPVLIRTGWFIIIDKYPEAENDFDVELSFDFEKDEDNEWAASGHVDNVDKVDCLIFGMAKMIMQEDPIIDELIEKNLEELDLPDHIQHFDPTC